MTAAPDLRAWKAVPPPKHKKDYGGKLLRVHKPTREKYGDDNKRRAVPDEVIPPGAVLKLRRRETNGAGKAMFTCDWPCPCCGSNHSRYYLESDIADGKLEFVERAEGLEPHIRPVIYLAAPYMVILMLDGIHSSEGVAAEIAFARKKGLPLWQLDLRDGEYVLHLLADYDIYGNYQGGNRREADHEQE